MSLLFTALHQAAQDHRAAIAAQQSAPYTQRVPVSSARHNWVNLGVVLLIGVACGVGLAALLLQQSPSLSLQELRATTTKPIIEQKLVAEPAAQAPVAQSSAGASAILSPSPRMEMLVPPPDETAGMAEGGIRLNQSEDAPAPMTRQQVQDTLPAPVVAAIAREIKPYVEPPQKPQATKPLIAVTTPAESAVPKPTVQLARSESTDDLSNTIAHYEAVLARDPHNKAALVGRATAWENSGATSIALAQWRVLADKYPDDATIATRYAAVLATVDAGAARGVLRRVLNRQPQNPSALAALAALDAKSGNIAAAQSGQEQAWALEKQNPAHRLNLAILADKRGDKAQALLLYKQAQEAYAKTGWKATLPMSWSAVQARIDYLARLAP